MNKILKKIVWSGKEPGIKEYIIEHPEIARKHQAGQFVILRVNDKGERFPITVADKSPEDGTISLVVQEVGKSTIEMGRLSEGSSLLDIVGPLGLPTHIEKFGTVACVGGGVGVATMHTITKKMKEEGNNVISIIGAKTKDLILYEEKMTRSSDRVIITTDDGSYGKKGLVTESLQELITTGTHIDLVVTVGPPIMMKMVAKTTEKYNIKTYASLNTIMVDGTGMCGVCRVTVGGQTKFVCVDGPEFDAHKVDFDEMMQRMAYYKEEEQTSKEMCVKGECY